MLKLFSEGKTIQASKSKVGFVYKFGDRHVMRCGLFNGLRIEGDTYGCTVPFVDLETGIFDLMDAECDLKYVGFLISSN